MMAQVKHKETGKIYDIVNHDNDVELVGADGVTVVIPSHEFNADYEAVEDDGQVTEEPKPEEEEDQTTLDKLNG